MASVSPSHRPGCARLGFARLQAFRLNVYESIVISRIDGVLLGGHPTGLRIEGASIEHVLNDQPDTASFRASAGVHPVAGQTIEVYDAGRPDLGHQLFGGRVIESTVLYESQKHHVAFDIRCIDPTWLMNRRRVLATYANQSASAIVLDLVSRFCRGVTTRHVAPGLPTLDAVTFTNELLPQCLTTICERIGGSWYLDYQSDLHVFLTESETAGSITDASPRTSRNHTLSEDLSQVVTRVIGRGGGVGASIDHAAGAVELLIDEGDEPQSWYSATGGTVEVNTQLLTYAGVRGLGATGALVGTGNAPSAAPRPTPAAGNTHTVGATYGYAVTFTTAAGESLPGPVRAITIQTINPVAPPAVAARGRPPGSYPPGLISPGATHIAFAVQIQYRAGAFGPLGAGTAWLPWDGNDWEVYVGPRSYYTHSDGSSAFYYPTLEPGGPAAPTAYVLVYRMDNAGPAANQWQYTTGDSFYSGGWIYQCACGYSSGGTLVFSPSGYGTVDLYDVPISKAPVVTGRKIYRTTANGSALKLLATIANNTADQYADRSADAALGAAPPASDSSGIKDEGQVNIGATSLPVSSTTPFAADMIGGVTPGGWVRLGGMIVRYTGIGSGALTGVPASGVGSITAVIRYGAQVLVQPRLVGIPASGSGALLAPIRKGDTVTIRIVIDDPTAISQMANRLTPTGQNPIYEDGVVEEVLSDSRFGLVELTAQCTAHLTDRKSPAKTLTFESRDPSLQVGRLITIDISQPPISGTFRIQRIGFSEIAVAGGRASALPLKRIEATSKLFTFANLLRQLRGREGGVP
jgi:hypothetical protein